MKKNILLSLLSAAIFSMSVMAQKENANRNIKFGIGAVVGLPLSTHKIIEGMAYEAGLLAEFPQTELVSITGSASYFGFTAKNGVQVEGGAIPVLIGAKIKIAGNVYGHAQAGVSFVTASGGGSAFSYSPSLGYQLSRNIDISLRYFAMTKNQITESYISLRAGFTF